ncbi:hypothetical protein BGY98DRAFT_678006 [Russula aff. rugulosa BPL654]|nr:hypothetical protein BGY98DRAFT_678006 [Russula aff. rugulosa BPL654]
MILNLESNAAVAGSRGRSIRKLLVSKSFRAVVLTRFSLTTSVKRGMGQAMRPGHSESRIRFTRVSSMSSVGNRYHQGERPASLRNALNQIVQSTTPTVALIGFLLSLCPRILVQIFLGPVKWGLRLDLRSHRAWAHGSSPSCILYHEPAQRHCLITLPLPCPVTIYCTELLAS